MGTASHFYVEPRLIQVLGSQYRSSEEAIKELVVNAWDADATSVEISLPEPFSRDPIVISDNGSGMTRWQVEHEFLRIAYDRRAKHGTKTGLGRLVRGFRGIGKFAGLVTAETMILRTVAQGAGCLLVLNRSLIEQQGDDLERASIQIEDIPADRPHGTTIELHNLRQTFTFPVANKLGRALLREFGRQDNFAISISGEVLSPTILEAPASPVQFDVPSLGPISGTIWISDNARALPDPGIIIRVNGRAVGPPTFFGLEKDPDVPKSLLQRVFGEVIADGLRDDVVASWGEFIENSQGYQELVQAGRAKLKDLVLGRRDTEAGKAPEQFVESYSDKIEQLPLPRRELARQALLRVFQRLFDDPEEKKKAIAEVVLNAFEIDEYWLLVQRINETPRGDILTLAEILRQWGLSEVAEIVRRAKRRLKAIEAFENLVRDLDTLELSGVHRALEQNVWMLGDEYEILKSNRGLRKLVEDVFGTKYSGARAKERPDLFLAGLRGRYLLVELKKPSITIGRKELAQGQTYWDEIHQYCSNAETIDLVVIGGKVDPNLQRHGDVHARATTFREVALEARERMEWLIEHLGGEGEDEQESASA